MCKYEDVDIFVDGACSGNPGPGGIGVIMTWRSHEKEISRSLGDSTNNRAELSAAIEGLKSVKDLPSCAVTLFTDSQLVHGFLSRGWKAKANVALVVEARELSTKCAEFKCIKVSTNWENPYFRKADELAKAACFLEEKRKENGDAKDSHKKDGYEEI